MAVQECDIVVIGAGPAGEVVAGRLAGAGRKVVLVERHLVGGECSYYGCMPSKALLRPAQLLAEVQRVPGAREAVTGTLDPAVVFARRDEVVHDLDDAAQLPWLEERGVELVRGLGALAGERRVTVHEEGGGLVAEFEAREAVVIAVGTVAALPPVPGLAEARPWTNREVTTAHAAPARLGILGGGPIGVEMAQAYASLGSDVTLMEVADRLLAREESFAGEQVADALREAGVHLELGAEVTQVERDAGDGGRVHVTLADGASNFAFDELLVAAGRRVPGGELNVGVVGAEDDKPIVVNDHLQVEGHPWCYVVGDANGRSLLTHTGKYQARVAADHILGHGEARAWSDRLPPRVTFTEPQVAAVGHTLQSALDAGIEARAVDQPTSANAGGSFYGRNSVGLTRLVVDESRQVLVGATFTGPDVAEFLHAATIAIVAEVPLRTLWHAIPSFPTRSEVWLRLLEKYGL